MTEFFAQPDDLGDIRASDMHASLGERLGAQAGEAFMGGVRTVGRGIQYGFAGGEAMPGLNMPDVPSPADLELNRQIRQDIPDTPIADAKARVKQEGLEGHLKLPEQDSIKGPVLDLMVAHAHERRHTEAAIARGPQGFFPDALGFVTEIGAGIIDPVNAAAFSIPVLGEARLGMMIARAGDSIASRAGVKALAGAAQGAVGSTALMPADWALHTRDGQDFTMAQALRSVVLGAGMGAAAHAGIGAFRDSRARARGEPLEGSPADLLARGLMGGTHVHARALAEEGVAAHDVPGIGGDGRSSFETTIDINGDRQTITGDYDPAEILGPLPADHPAHVLTDLPPRVRENVTQAAIADVIGDRPVRVGQMLDIAATQDPRIAETIDAWHGSPHDFEAFDLNKLGTGEGAQAYGHGHYLAQEEAVARKYMKSTTFRDFNRKVQELYSEFDSTGDARLALAESKDFTPSQKRLLAALEKDDWLGFDYPHQAVTAAIKEPGAFDMSPETHAALRDLGNLYKVRINADHEHMLDWDKPIDEQSAHVQAALKQVFGPLMPGQEHASISDLLGMHGKSGKEIYQHLVRQQAGSGGFTSSAGMKLSDFNHKPQQASEALHAAGVRGVKYLDQGSRGGLTPKYRVYQEGERFFVSSDKPRQAGPFETAAEAEQWVKAQATRNFVVFNDKDVEITHKNGEPVTREEIAAAHRPSADVLPGPPAAKGPRARDEQSYSLLEFLARNGGLAPHPDVGVLFGGRNKFVPGFGNLIRRTGMSLDRAREAAVEAGYLHDAAQQHGGVTESTINHLLEGIDAEARGSKQYRAGSEPEAKTNREHNRVDMERALDGALEEVGVKPSEVSGKLRDRVLQIMEREGVSDPLVAHERAVMEETQHVADAGQAERIPDHVAGWDVPDDAGAAPGAGRAARPELVAGGAGARAPAPAARPGDRGATDAWRKLADQRDPDAAADLAASREAAATPELPSVDTRKTVSAAEKAAAEADALIEDIKGKLTPDELARFQDVLDTLKADKEALDQVVRDGTACLLEAAG